MHYIFTINTHHTVTLIKSACYIFNYNIRRGWNEQLEVTYETQMHTFGSINIDVEIWKVVGCCCVILYRGFVRAAAGIQKGGLKQTHNHFTHCWRRVDLKGVGAKKLYKQDQDYALQICNLYFSTSSHWPSLGYFLTDPWWFLGEGGGPKVVSKSLGSCQENPGMISQREFVKKSGL